MAIRNEDGTFQPGYIYELRYEQNEEHYPFYVGETTDLDRRYAEHAAAGRAADSDSTSVYQAIHDFDSAGIKWNIFKVAEYGAAGPEDLENQYIIQAIQAGANLMNEKKGNENWMAEMQAAAADMTSRGIDSYREYRRVTEAERAARRSAVRNQDSWRPSVDPLWRPPPIHDTLAVIRQLKEQQEAKIKRTRKSQPIDRSAASEIWDGATQQNTPDAAWRAQQYFESTGETQLAEYWQQIYQDRLNQERD